MSTDDIKDYYKRALEKGSGFTGQLDRDFQARLARAYANPPLDRCTFYHTMEFADHEVIEGIWDLRGREPSYLGHIDVSGQRVLELGPASGHMSYYMERKGADVVCFELVPGVSQEVIPQVGHDLEEQRRLCIRYAEEIRNSWWYGHTRLKSNVKVVYGDIYDLPQDIGRFDIATFGCILLHLSNPFHALKQAADRTDKALIVTDTLDAIPDDEEPASMTFVPVDTHKESVVVWWGLTPGAIIRMLKILGFIEISVHYHVQKVFFHHDLSKPPISQLCFTVVGERVKGRLNRFSRTESEIKAELDLKRGRSCGTGKTKQLEAEIQALRESTSWHITKPLRIVAAAARRLLS